MLDLIHRHDLSPERVKRVAVGTNHNMPNALIHHRPRNELQAKFSMEFCMAILLLERKAGLEQLNKAGDVGLAHLQRAVLAIDHPEGARR
jgi:2-methylcitrate dehydratase PrpD